MLTCFTKDTGDCIVIIFFCDSFIACWCSDVSYATESNSRSTDYHMTIIRNKAVALNLAFADPGEQLRLACDSDCRAKLSAENSQYFKKRQPLVICTFCKYQD